MEVLPLLYPQSNAARTVLDLSGVRNFLLGRDNPWHRQRRDGQAH